MHTTDPIADYLTRIRNGIGAKHKRIDVPASGLKREISRILAEKKFIAGFSEVQLNATPDRAVPSAARATALS